MTRRLSQMGGHTHEPAHAPALPMRSESWLIAAAGGRDAFRRGDPVTAAPFTSHDSSWKAWRLGWVCASRGEDVTTRYRLKPEARRGRVSRYENTDDIAGQFERMAKGLTPICSAGDAVVWVTDSTITDDLRAWCRETAAMIRREAQIAATLKPRKAYPIRRTASQMEAEIAAVLQFKPDATAHDIRIATGIEHSWILRSETWIMSHMGQGDALAREAALKSAHVRGDA